MSKTECIGCTDNIPDEAIASTHGTAVNAATGEPVTLVTCTTCVVKIDAAQATFEATIPADHAAGTPS